jgi:DNA-binding transcriptional ArsR family regulator
MSTDTTSTSPTDDVETITVGETAGGADVELPVVEVLTGRGFVTGKSGSGKSNTASVVVEELLDAGYPVLIVDTDGEYFGLKEQYELLHAGADEECDIQVAPEHAERLATLALEENVPIILDVSGYLDEDVADELVRETARHLFAKEKQLQKPFLLIVEEVHEYLPQQGGAGETGKMLVKIGKRGRKRGLGIMGISQRPADVKKDFITQANWLVWHRLTWENDTQVVRRVVSSDVADEVEGLGDGDAFVQTDWTEADVERVQFRRKHTFDAGATPGLEDVERPELKSVGEDLLEELDEISERADRRRNRVAELEQQLEERNERIDELERELDNARDVSNAAQQFASALQDGVGESEAGVPEDFDEQLQQKNDRIHDLEAQVDELETAIADRDERIQDLQSEVERLGSYRDRVDEAEEIEAQLQAVEAWVASMPTELVELSEQARELFDDVGTGEAAAYAGGEDVDVAALRERVDELERENEQLREEPGDADGDDLATLVQHGAVQAAVDVAKDGSDRAGEHFERALGILASADGGPLGAGEIAPLMDGVSDSTVNAVLRALFDAGVVRREKDGRSYEYTLDRQFLERRIDAQEAMDDAE